MLRPAAALAGAQLGTDRQREQQRAEEQAPENKRGGEYCSEPERTEGTLLVARQLSGSALAMAYDAMHGNMQPWQSDGADLRSVAQEVRDQQEAIEALMDMLEKTITVEVRLADAQ